MNVQRSQQLGIVLSTKRNQRLLGLLACVTALGAALPTHAEPRPVQTQALAPVVGRYAPQYHSKPVASTESGEGAEGMGGGIGVSPNVGEIANPAGSGTGNSAGASSNGLWGTDLGLSFAHEGKLWVMFGDSWKEKDQYDIGLPGLADDALGQISLADFPNGDAVDAFIKAHPAAMGRPSWQAVAPPMTLARRDRNDPNSEVAPILQFRDGIMLGNGGPALTPIAGFSNARSGDASGAFAIFLPNEKLACAKDPAVEAGQPDEYKCGGGYTCHRELGLCIEEATQKSWVEVWRQPIETTPPTATSPTCVVGAPLDPNNAFCRKCVAISEAPGGFEPDKWKDKDGLCVDEDNMAPGGKIPLAATAPVPTTHEVGNAQKDENRVFDTQSWTTHRFYNMTARTVKDFDPSRANGAGNDYATADGTTVGRDAVFMWGRGNFGGVVREDRDARLYFAYVPMPNYSKEGKFDWRPQYLSGFEDNGAPRFSSAEKDAMQLDLDAATPGVQPNEALDIVGQMSVSWVPGLKRWVMFYGGGLGKVFGDLIFGVDQEKFNKSKIGPIYVRYAEQPWGPWTAPQPLMEPGNPGDPSGYYAPGSIMFSSACSGDQCVEHEVPWGEESGGLYAPYIVDPWTTDRGDAVDVYWHVSTWNPYQVVLMKTTFQK